ncbi:hypothetical protein [Brucella pituitosa]|uniref:hypothetical protein n=1 Tax=Brucella pituitosa TaxID=571256 RepID=UPI003F4AA5B8
MKRRDVGTIGENEFISWCEPEGFKWTRPSNDRLGWDFILEREPEPRDDLPLDRQNELPKFLVQIKSTDRLGEAPRIKLSALKHLVDADMPAVIIILEFGKGARQPKRCRVVTVDAQLISYALHRTRQREAAGKRSLHKERVRIPLDGAIELSPTGEGLSKTLDHMVGGSFSDYVKDKIRIRETCGYDEGMATGRFAVRGKDAKERIQNLLLGRSSEIDVADLTIENRRFGISLANDTSFFDQAVLEYHAPAFELGRSNLKKSKRVTGRGFRSNCTRYRPWMRAMRKRQFALQIRFLR